MKEVTEDEKITGSYFFFGMPITDSYGGTRREGLELVSMVGKV